jgi:hypothetical protein
VHYFIAGNEHGPGGPGGHDDNAASQITEWVKQNFAAEKVGDSTVYDLSVK